MELVQSLTVVRTSSMQQKHLSVSAASRGTRL